MLCGLERKRLDQPERLVRGTLDLTEFVKRTKGQTWRFSGPESRLLVQGTSDGRGREAEINAVGAEEGEAEGGGFSLGLPDLSNCLA